MDGKHLRDSGFLGEDVQGAGGGTGRRAASSGKEADVCVCVEPHVLILIHIEYERQAETQLVTSELAPCYLWEHMPSASSSATPWPPPSSQLNEAGFWAGDTTQGPMFNKTNHNHFPGAQFSPQPMVICSLLSSPQSLHFASSSCFQLHYPWKG